MATENQLTGVWTYNMCSVKGEPYLLLTQRKGYEEFWHTTCGMVNSATDGDYTDQRGIEVAKKSVLQESQLDISTAKITTVYMDIRGDSAWKPNILYTNHVLADLGDLEALPKITPTLFSFGEREVGLMDAKWVKLSDLTVSKSQANVDPSASPYVSHQDRHLRSMIVSVLTLGVIPQFATNRNQTLHLDNGLLTSGFDTINEQHPPFTHQPMRRSFDDRPQL